ncbi:unnamed protein product [Ceutorhynchus assimilis]|uniref:BHLH domain-containing protein n=1 Tax=Ceutorhynchus assimilis TaxID=467358 RepID=A0A9N9MWX9_9CUCU|nr:unnamed protein product [Ceutorhynchus assimilis]
MAYLVQHKQLDKPGKECIHSGQFMVSQFEAEEQDDEDNVAVPIPEVIDNKALVTVNPFFQSTQSSNSKKTQQQLFIDQSLSKLFHCMSLAYRQKLTSPKWNRFRGIRLRWKDKIRLNNVIWRCWHLQFIKKENTLICQFASPLDVDTHNKPEAIVLEGKYWKRKLAAVTAEYKKWRMFYRNHLCGHVPKEDMDMLNDVDAILGDSNSMDNMNMMIDEDYMGLMSDTLFSTITNQPFAFPDTRELAKSGFADFIQPSLGPLQPNLDDYMDTFDPLQELYLNNKLPTVPEEQPQSVTWVYRDYPDAIDSVPNSVQYQPQLQNIEVKSIQNQNVAFSDVMLQSTESYVQNSSYPIIAKAKPTRGKLSQSMPSTSYVYNQPSVNELAIIQVSKNQAVDTFVQQQSGYKFAAPSRPSTKFTSQQQNMPQVQTQMTHLSMHVAPQTSPYHSNFSTVQKDDSRTERPRVRGAPRGRGRSRSNTREPMKRPPLLSAASEPVLLTQLLTTSSPLSEAVQAYNQSQNLGSSPDLSQHRRIKEEASPILASPTLLTLTNGDPPYLSPYSSPLDSPVPNLHSPTSSQGSIGSPGREGSSKDRRVGHIHAEQKRRCNIKNGFDMIHSLIPQLNQNPNAKLSKAAMLQKGAEYIRQLRSERNQLKDEMESLRQQIETLNTSISNCQSMLPATGAPVSRRRDSRMQEMFDKYVSRRTMENWKFWIFSLICRPLLNSFNNFVSSSSLDDLYSSTLLWVEQHCTLVDLRPVVLNSLRYLCTKTEILSEPEKLPDEARKLVLIKDK